MIDNKIIMNPEDCRNHTLNTSGSKYAYKFCKSNRFKTPRLHTHNIYNVTDNQTRKACGFGYGDRHSVVNKSHNASPSPQAYMLPSTIAQSKSKTFGSSRQDTKFQSFLLSAMKAASNPSPLTYNMPTSLHTRKYSLGARLPTDIDLKLKNVVPAPGTYNINNGGNASDGKFASTKYRNIQKIIFFGRDQVESKQFPVGPGSYNISPSLDENHFRKTCKSFGTAYRPGPEDRSKRNIPGPGMYETFSQFPCQF